MRKFAVAMSLAFSSLMIHTALAKEPVAALQALLASRSCGQSSQNGVWDANTVGAAQAFATASRIPIERPLTEELLGKLRESNASCTTGLNISKFIPKDVLDDLNAIDPSVRSHACVGNLAIRRDFSRLQPTPALGGLTSQMYNVAKGLEPFSILDDFASDSSAIVTSAFVRNSDADKDLLMKVYSNWAAAGAYEKTKDCSYSGDACGGSWHSKRGLELAPIKDYQSVEERLVPVAFAYYLFLKDYKRTELATEHIAIEKWLGTFIKRLSVTGSSKSAQVFFGFGLNWQTWGYPLSDLLHGDEAGFEKRVNNLAVKLDSLVAEDGSLDQRTIRGARALWYHQSSLNELFFALEMAKANGTDLYPKFQNRIEKAVTIFMDGVDDVSSGRNTFDNPARIYKWAKTDFHSQNDPRVQIWRTSESNALSDWGSWIFTFLYRTPNSPVADRLRAFVAAYDHLPMKDAAVGFNTGCIYRLADPKLRNREASQSATIQDNTIADLTKDVGKQLQPVTTASLNYDSVTFSPSFASGGSAAYYVHLYGLKLGTQTINELNFSILTDFSKPTRQIGDLELFRIAVNGSSAKDPASKPQAMSSCGNLASGNNNGFRFHFGHESKLNACVFEQLGPSDQLLWASVFQAFPAILKKASAGGSDQIATSLEVLLQAKLKQKN